MTFHDDLIERFVVSMQSTSLCSKPIYINRASGISTHFSSVALDSITAAGWANRLGSSLFRLKYGLDAAVYKNVLIEYRRIAIEAAHLLEWPDDELTEFLAEFVLLSWLTDRRLWVKGELRERAEILRKMIKEEERQTASFMVMALL